MYEARQNKEKVSRRIDGNNENSIKNSYLDRENKSKIITQRTPISIQMFRRKQMVDKNTIQRRFYLGSIALCDENTIRYELERNIKHWFMHYAELANMLYNKYNNEDIDMSIEILKQEIDNMWFFQRANNNLILKKLNDLNQEDIKKKIKEVRIKEDTRLLPKAQEKYLNNPNSYKNSIEKERNKWRKNNMEQADKELRTGKYLKDNYKSHFRELMIPNPINDSLEILHKVVLNKVLKMRGSLMAAWYFNAENEAEILEAKELQSHSVRRDLNPGTKIKSKSMSDDTIINRTGRYFYSFIEHKDTKFNTNTRFSQPTTNSEGFVKEGIVKDGSGRRLRIPLIKMAKANAAIMGGDLVEDRQEQCKIGLKQNETPRKIFASGKETDNADNLLKGLLINYVSFVFSRISIALKKLDMEGRIIPPGTQNPINMEIAKILKKIFFLI